MSKEKEINSVFLEEIVSNLSRIMSLLIAIHRFNGKNEIINDIASSIQEILTDLQKNEVHELRKIIENG